MKKPPKKPQQPPKAPVREISIPVSSSNSDQLGLLKVLSLVFLVLDD